MPMHISIVDAATTRNKILTSLLNIFVKIYRIGELDLAIADYSTALEIDSKSSTSNSNL